jgi:hypothetical protein
MSEQKQCNHCNIILTDEIKVKDRNECKSCRNIKYKEYVATKLANSYNSTIERKCTYCSVLLNQDNMVKNRPNCKSCYNAKSKEYKKNNKETVSENHKQYYENNKDKISEYYKDHYKNNKDTYMENNRKWREENRETINMKANERFKNDPIAKLKKVCRTRIAIALKKNSLRSLKLIDCDIQFLKEWLQSQFDDKMTFENHGTYWHIDHVIPCATFDLTIEDEIKHCFRWTNLQPLEAKKNMEKQDKLDKEEVIQHYKKVNDYATLHKLPINKILNDFNYMKYF